MIYSVQYMRAIAALLVVMSHAGVKGAQYSNDPLHWFNVGGIGVDLFFIISGYIMCHTASNRKINFLGFMKARFLRILPLYWFLTSLALVIYLIFPDKINSSGGNTNVIASYTLFPTEDKYLNQNGWTLSYEFFFYFIFSFCLFSNSKLKYLIPVGMITILFILGELLTPKNFQLNFITNSLLLEFSFGILAYYFHKEIKISSTISILIIIFSILSITSTNILNPDYPRVIIYGIPAFIFFIGMIQIEHFFENHKKKPFSKLLKSIGDSSYSLYLSHPFALVASALLLKSTHINTYGYTFVIILSITSVFAGHICYILIEKKLNKYVNLKFR
jgi:exopolysaccharide production protein ExoZ